MRLERRTYVLSMLFLLSIHPFVWSQDADFIEAANQASAQKYEEALRIWKTMPEESQHTYEWVANVAMAEEKLGDLIVAKSKWLSLQKEYGPDQLIKTRLHVINSDLKIQNIDNSPFWGISFKGEIVRSIYWMVIFGVLSLLSLIISIRFRNKDNKKPLKLILSVLSGLALLIVLQYVWQQRQMRNLPTYVLNVDQEWDYETESSIKWSKGLSLRVIEEKGEKVMVENNLGERIVIPKDDLVIYKF